MSSSNPKKQNLTQAGHKNSKEVPEFLKDYSLEHFYDEMISSKGAIRKSYGPLALQMNQMGWGEILQRQGAAERALVSMGITFSVYQDGAGIEKIFPFDIIPRIISAEEWDRIERGLKQRVLALNFFIQDIYGPQKILKDAVLPKDVLFSSPGYLAQCEGLSPPHKAWAHISGIDLIKHSDGINYVLEDNLRVPSGVSYVLESREIMKRTFPEIFEQMNIQPIQDYPLRLLEMLEHLSPREKPTVVVLTPGIYNSAYFEHSFLAQQMGVELIDTHGQARGSFQNNSSCA